MPDVLSICRLENTKTIHPHPENQAVSLCTALPMRVTQRQSSTIKQFSLFSQIRHLKKMIVNTVLSFDI